MILVILFVLAAVGVDLGSIAIVPLGLAFFAGAFLGPDEVSAPFADRARRRWHGSTSTASIETSLLGRRFNSSAIAA